MWTFDVKPSSPRRRLPGRNVPARDVIPPDVPEVVATPASEPREATDPIPEHIRRMLEAAYT